MVSFPVCKINLGLHIINKRPDGYHNLETCFYPVPCTDILEIIPAETFAFTHSGIDIPGDPEKNLCVKAYRLLAYEHDLPPVKIHLHKVIPTGAGLGGGSSDAAYTLRTLNTLFNLRLTGSQLIHYASQLGSDCAFFIHDEPMLGKGRGEVLEKISIDLQGRYLMLVKPDIHISTPEAFAGIKPKTPERSIKEILENIPIQQWKNELKNDFEDPVFVRYPALAGIKDTLYASGAMYAGMSGSGSTVFGIFEHPVVVSDFSGYFVWLGKLD